MRKIKKNNTRTARGKTWGKKTVDSRRTCFKINNGRRTNLFRTSRQRKNQRGWQRSPYFIQPLN